MKGAVRVGFLKLESHTHRRAGWCLLLSFLLCLFTAQAQRETFSSYGSEAGLTNLNVTAMVQDAAGIVWLGTQNGVFKANGMQFERQAAFDAAGIILVTAMHIDAVGRMWVVSDGGFGYQDATGVHAIPGLDFDRINEANVALASRAHHPESLLVAKGGILLEFVTRDDGKTWQMRPALPGSMVEQHPELRQVTALTTDLRGEVWAGCGKSLCELSPALDTVRVWGEQDGVPPDRWSCLLTTRLGAVWARGDRALSALSPGTERFRTVEPLPEGLYLNIQMPSLVEDPEGRILVNVSKGIAREERGKWRILNSGSGLPRDEIDALFFDRSGLLWLAPSGHGIAHWRGYGEWESWTPNEGLSSETVWNIAKDRTGDIWVATERGLDRLTLKTGQIIAEPESHGYMRVRSTVVDPRGHVWTGDAVGHLKELDPQLGTVRVAGEFGRILQLFIDRRHRIWVLSRMGIDHLDPEDGWKVLHHVDSVPVKVASAVTEGPDGTLWFSTAQGLYRLKSDAWQLIHLPGRNAGEINFALAAAGDGTLWIESRQQNPVLHLQVVGDTAAVLGDVSSTLIGSNNITFLNFDQRGWLWVGSDAGVGVFDGHRWVQCTTEDGLLWDDTDSYAFYADADGSVWIGTSGGLSRLRHPETLFSEGVPALLFADIHLGPVTLSEDRPGAAASPRFDLRHPALTVGLLRTDYSRPSTLVYRYRLSGLENEWQETTDTQLRYPALPPGDYTLTVIAYDRRLHISCDPKTISFTLLPPWWQRWWFHGLERIGVLALLLVVWRGSVRILVARQQELEAQVRERTGELEAEKVELERARAELLEMTRRDGLTGLLNRSAIFEKMAEECKIALRTGNRLAVVMADLDRFKHINDTHGHVVGDAVIRQCAERLKVTIRPGDSVGRYGGEELLLLMPGLEPPSAPDRLEELRAAVASEPVCYGDVTLWITCSFGVAWLGPAPYELEALVGAADAALYRAKEKGRNRFEFADEEEPLSELVES